MSFLNLFTGIAAINQAKAQREADKESEQEGTPLRVGNKVPY
jgi:hypothetical protein